jgi:hypothetical protein
LNVYINLLLAHYCVGDKIKKNDMGGACSLGGGGEACAGFWWGNLRQRDHWGDRHRFEDNIKMDLQEVE